MQKPGCAPPLFTHPQRHLSTMADRTCRYWAARQTGTRIQAGTGRSRGK